MRDERGQTSAEYMGILLVVAAIVGALIASGLHRDVAAAARSAVCTDRRRVVRGRGPAAAADSGPDADADGVSDRKRSARARTRSRPTATATGARTPRSARPAPIRRRPTPTATACSTATTRSRDTADADGDGLSDGEEIALGTDARKADSDGDGRADRVEYEEGTDPLQRIAPLTEKNAFTPWERVGMSEDEWRDFEREVLDEVTPDGIEGFLVGSPYIGVTLDEEGKLKLIEVQQMGLNPGPLLSSSAPAAAR